MESVKRQKKNKWKDKTDRVVFSLAGETVNESDEDELKPITMNIKRNSITEVNETKSSEDEISLDCKYIIGDKEISPSNFESGDNYATKMAMKQRLENTFYLSYFYIYFVSK